jgi:hypothetical protein
MGARGEGRVGETLQALALDLATKARRRHDEAVEAGLSAHNRIEIAQVQPDTSGRMKAAFEGGQAREAFAQQCLALETLLEAAVERMKQAAALLAERTKSATAAILRTEDSSQYSNEPKSTSPSVVSHPGPRL